jgi:hypothetical protein
MEILKVVVFVLKKECKLFISTVQDQILIKNLILFAFLSLKNIIVALISLFNLRFFNMFEYLFKEESLICALTSHLSVCL